MTTTFSRDVSKWVGRTRNRADNAVKGLTRFCLSSMAEFTPVDTGRARASWRFGLNRIDFSFDRRPERDSAGFSAAQSAGDAAFAAQYAEISRQAEAGSIIWLTNDIHYVLRLERGYSLKGRDMLRKTFARAVVEWPSIVRRSAGPGAAGNAVGFVTGSAA